MVRNKGKIKKWNGYKLGINVIREFCWNEEGGKEKSKVSLHSIGINKGQIVNKIPNMEAKEKQFFANKKRVR